LYFADKATSIVSIQESIKDYSNITNVMFYWSPDSCDLLCKQAHTVFKYTKTNDDIKRIFSHIDKIKFSELQGPHNDWGHTPRQFGLDNASEEWVVMSGDDNYYSPNFVDTFLSTIDNNTNFIYCDMLHNHDTFHTNSYKYFEHKNIILIYENGKKIDKIENYYENENELNETTALLNRNINNKKSKIKTCVFFGD
jgi:hypothetical protein